MYFTCTFTQLSFWHLIVSASEVEGDGFDSRRRHQSVRDYYTASSITCTNRTHPALKWKEKLFLKICSATMRPSAFNKQSRVSDRVDNGSHTTDTSQNNSRLFVLTSLSQRRNVSDVTRRDIYCLSLKRLSQNLLTYSFPASILTFIVFIFLNHKTLLQYRK